MRTTGTPRVEFDFNVQNRVYRPGPGVPGCPEQNLSWPQVTVQGFGFGR